MGEVIDIIDVINKIQRGEAEAGEYENPDHNPPEKEGIVIDILTRKGEVRVHGSNKD